jgi:hypothetical protein
MTSRAPITPDYCDRETLARRLDMTPGYVDQLVKRGILPGPVAIGEAKRWRWADVDAALRSGATGDHAGMSYDDAADPYISGAARAASSPARQARHQKRAAVLLPDAPSRHEPADGDTAPAG